MESDVYKMLQDYEKPISEPKQSGSFRYLQGMLEAGENGKEIVTHMCPSKSPTPPQDQGCGTVMLWSLNHRLVPLYPVHGPAPTKLLLKA